MILEIKDRKLLVTDMFISHKNNNVRMLYNVFDENYNHLTTIEAEDYDEFVEILNMRIALNKF